MEGGGNLVGSGRCTPGALNPSKRRRPATLEEKVDRQNEKASFVGKFKKILATKAGTAAAETNQQGLTGENGSDSGKGKGNRKGSIDHTARRNCVMAYGRVQGDLSMSRHKPSPVFILAHKQKGGRPFGRS